MVFKLVQKIDTPSLLRGVEGVIVNKYKNKPKSQIRHCNCEMKFFLFNYELIIREYEQILMFHNQLKLNIKLSIYNSIQSQI